MIKLTDFYSKPLISLYEGMFNGEIRAFFATPGLKNVSSCVLEDILLGNKVFRFIPLKKICAYSHSVAVTENDLCIKFREECTDEGFDFSLGIPLFSDKGEKLGTLTDVELSDSGETLYIFTENGSYPVEKIASASSSMIIIGDKIPHKKPRTVRRPRKNTKVQILSTVTPEKLKAEDETHEITAKSDENPTDATEVIIENSVKKSLTENTSVNEDLVATEESANNPSENKDKEPYHIPARLISDYKFLLGRMVIADIYNISGKKIIKRGEVVTASTVETARRFGRLVELTLNSKS